MSTSANKGECFKDRASNAIMKSASANSDRLFAGCRGCNQVEKVGGRELVMLTKVNGDSCIYISAQQGHLDVVKALLEVGRELVMIMHNGKTCLLISASKGHQEVLKALLEVGGREL